MAFLDGQIIVALIAGMVVQGVIQWLLSRNGQRQRIRQLEHEVEGLRDKVTLLESGHQDAPIPIWLKDQFGIMLALNKSYEETFLLPIGKTRADYLHQPDSKIWPEHIAEEYTRNDLMVFRTGRTWIGHETVVDHQGREAQWRVVKYARYAGGVRIGIAGMAIPES